MYGVKLLDRMYTEKLFIFYMIEKFEIRTCDSYNLRSHQKE